MSTELVQVETTEFLAAMQAWQDNGYNIMTAIRMFDTAEGGVLMGISRYQQQEQVLVTSAMSQGFPRCEQAFAAIGAMFDAYFARMAEQASSTH